uniref:NlpC/P60 domain-containing protein n=1 Tax=candidate division CPR3 bacterium TaxID=2268181 RepID=A0A7C4R4T5_UNCC3
MKYLIKKSYLKMIENSLETKMFRSFYVKIDGKEKDIMEKGKRSCANFVSSILYLFKLIKSNHATVKSTFEDAVSCGWELTNKPEKGDLVFWEELKGTAHVGFYWNGKEAISNSPEKGFPIKHSLDYEGKRKITHILHFDFDKLNKN